MSIDDATAPPIVIEQAPSPKKDVPKYNLNPSVTPAKKLAEHETKRRRVGNDI